MTGNQADNGFSNKLSGKKTVLKAAGELFCSAYLLLMFGIYPFYMEKGYVDIGEAKYRFFIYCSLAAAAILGAIGLCRYIQVLRRRIREREPYLIRWENFSATDLFVALYATEIFISYVLSDYRQEALWGREGWHIGLVPLLTLCGLYFFISRLWDGKAFIWYVSMAASAAVFLLGILDRFSIYIIPLEIRQPAFISTLGNINWFCGYLTVLAPVGIYIFLFSENERNNNESYLYKEKAKKRFAAGYAVIAFMAGFCQGSSSIFLFYGTLFFILLWISLEKRAWLANWSFLVCLWGLAAQLVRTMRHLLPDRYNYETDNLCGYLTDSNVTLVIGAAAFIIFLWLKKKNHDFARGQKAEKEADVGRKAKTARRIMALALAAGILFWLILTGFHTWKSVSDVADVTGTSPFLFDENWGNGRGAALKAGARMYAGMSFEKKLFGTGPDCFSAYAYSLPEVAGSLRENFGSERLTNAHNELFTGLINTGIMGVILYLGIFVSFIIRYAKKGDFYSRMAIVCILCYLSHNMVSFAQVLNLPFVFLIMAMGERAMKQRWGDT